MQSAKEIETYALTLAQCAQEFFTAHANAESQEHFISHVPATMSNWLSTANLMEDYLERQKKKSGTSSVSINDLETYLRSPATSLFEVMILFTPLTNDDAPITANDFRDGREVAENYTFGHYREKLPLLSSLLPQLREKAAQDANIRPIAKDKVQEMIVKNQRIIAEEPSSNGGLAAIVETPVLIKTLENLNQKATPPVGLNPV